MRFIWFLFVIALAYCISPCDCPAQAQKTPPTRLAVTSDCDLVAEATQLIELARRGGEGPGAARQRLRVLIETNPNSKVIPILNALAQNLDEKRATQLLRIAIFYRSREHRQAGAELRLRDIREQFPEYSRLDEVLFQLAQVQMERDHFTEARETLNELLTKFGWSPRAREARALVEPLKK